MNSRRVLTVCLCTLALASVLTLGACGGEAPPVASTEQAVLTPEMRASLYGSLNDTTTSDSSSTGSTAGSCTSSNPADNCGYPDDGIEGATAFNTMQAKAGKLSPEECWRKFSQGLIDGNLCPSLSLITPLHCLKSQTCYSFTTSPTGFGSTCASELNTYQGGYVAANCDCSTLYESGSSGWARSTVCCYGDACSAHEQSYTVGGSSVDRTFHYVLAVHDDYGDA